MNVICIAIMPPWIFTNYCKLLHENTWLIMGNMCLSGLAKLLYIRENSWEHAHISLSLLSLLLLLIILLLLFFHLHYYYMYTFISIITYPRHTSVKYYTFICLILSEGDLLLFIYNDTYSFYVDILRTFQHKICIWHFYTPFIEAKRQVQKPWTQSLMWN